MSENNNNWYPVFKAGKYPQIVNGKKVMVDIPFTMLQEIAANYQTSKHIAPVWIGHPNFDAPALGWIGAVKAEGNQLFVQFTEVSQKLKDLVNSGEYKKCSAEFYNWEDGWNFGALGITNMPAVKNLPVLQFSEQAMSEKMHIEDDLNFNFTQEETTPEPIEPENFSQLKNNMDKISQAVIKFAGSLGINISNFNCDEDVLTYVTNALNDVNKKFGDNPSQITSLSVYCTKCTDVIEENKAIKLQLTSDRTKSAEAIIAQGVAEGKFTADSEQAKSFKAFAENDPVAAASVVAALPKMKVLDQNVIQAGEVSVGSEAPAPGDAKFVMVGSEKITAEDVVKDSKKMEILNPAQLKTLGFE